MRRTARFHHDVRSAVVLEVTPQLTATETFAIHNLARLIGNSELEDVLCKVNRDSACVHGWSSLVCSSPRRHEHARCRRGPRPIDHPIKPLEMAQTHTLQAPDVRCADIRELRAVTPN